jgi:iron complex outermembrane recepter protein
LHGLSALFVRNAVGDVVMYDRKAVGALALASALGFCATLHAQTANQSETTLPAIEVTAPTPHAKKPRPARAAARPVARRSTRVSIPSVPRTAGPAGATGAGVPPIVERFKLPQESFSITARQIDETINIKDPEDAVKYMPGLFVRKRNDGDNQAVLATRTWGLNSSARTLIYEDDLLISALIGNNNTGASPHWNLVPPGAIERVDFLDGPFAAAYPGNSIGGVLIITTKMPDHFVADVKQTVSIMPWSQYDTKATYWSSVTSTSVGNRNGDFSWLVTTNLIDAYQQPLTYVTNATPPAGTTGTITALNKQGLPADVIGAGTVIHTQQVATNAKFAYDVTTWLRAAYSVGIWNNNQTSSPQTYLTSTASGMPTFAGISTFAANEYTWNQTQMSNAMSLKSDTKGRYDFDISASSYNYLQDIELNPYTVTPTGIGYSQNGKVTRNDGTNWQNVDAKGIWRPYGFDGAQEMSFGIHGDRYYLNNPTYASSIWNATSWTGNGQLYSDGQGETRTVGLWMQDVWKIAPVLKLTLGGRLESWQALDGFNLATNTTSAGVIKSTVTVNQPELQATNFSPKASISYDPSREWNVTANFGEAYRYPTVTELYQNISVNGLATFANPNLTPEQDFNAELNIERKWPDGRVRLTLFAERTNNAIISQTNLATNPTTGAQVPTTTIGNVAAIRMDGAEVAAEKDDVAIKGLQLFGSVTYVDSRILSDPTWAGANPLSGLPDSVVGNRVPYVPDWRAKFGFTYRPAENWTWTVAARYSGKQYSTLDNTDIISHVYGAFDNYFVVDAKVHYKASDNFYFDFGIDNVFNEQYFLFHPFPGRTYVMAGRFIF